MQYQKKKEEILEGVQFHNLLSFNLVQNKLQRNFRHIVDALLLNQGRTDALNQNFSSYRKENDDKVKDIKDKLKDLEKMMKETGQKENNGNSRNSLKNINNEDQNSNANSNSNNDKNQLLQQNDKPNINSNSSILQRNSIKQLVDKNRQKNDQELQRLKNQIQKIKRDMPSTDYLENQIKQALKDIGNIKGQLLTINQNGNGNGNGGSKTSMKSLKRTSINNNELANNNNQKKTILNNKENNSDLNTSTNQEDGGQLMQKIEKQLNSVHIDLNTFRLSLEQLRDICGNLKKKELKHTSQINDLNELTKKMERKQTQDIEGLQKSIKGLQMDIMNININQGDKQQQNNTKQKQKEKEKNISSSKTDFNQNINYKNQINDKFSKLQAMLNSCVSESQFNRFKNQTRDKFAKVDKDNQQLKQNLDQEVKKIYEIIDSLKNMELQNLKKDIDQLKENNQEKSSQWERKHNITLSKIEEVKKNLQNLRQDVEFYQSMNTQNGQNKGGNNTNNNGNNNSNDNDDQKGNSGVDSKELQRLKKSLNNKIQDQRLYLLGLIRDLQRKLTPKGSIEQDIVGIWDRISQLNLFINKKADSDDIKKNIAYLQKKIGMMANHLMKSQQGNQDARIAKTNWFCLSCDKNLHNYSGKVGKHVVWDYMPLKTQSKFVREQKKTLPNIGHSNSTNGLVNGKR